MTLHVPTYRTIDVPVHGNPSEVDQMGVEVDAPPEPEDYCVPIDDPAEMVLVYDDGWDQIYGGCREAIAPPEPTDEDVPEWAVDLGCGPIDFAELGRLDKQMNRERAAALRDLGEPLLPAELLS
jgi:hypothetical protein